jgi:hypothetical protein
VLSARGGADFCDVALDLLKRHSGIVWDPGRFAGLLRGGDVRRLGNPVGAPALGLTPQRHIDCAQPEPDTTLAPCYSCKTSLMSP